MKRFGVGFSFLLALILFAFACSASQKETLDSLIEKGKILVENGTYDAGIAVLETVRAKDPRNSKALTILLSAYDAYAQKLSSEGRLKQAEAMLTKTEDVLVQLNSIPDAEFSDEELKSQSRIKRERAEAKLFLASQNTSTKTANSVIALNSGRQKFNDAVEHFNKKDYDLAEQLLKESVEIDPKNPYAYELLADIANLRHRLEDAENYYKQAFAINPDQRLRFKLEKLQREKKVDETQQEYSDEHFIIRYRRDENFEGSEIRQFLRDAYRDISQELGYYPSYKIPVTLYSRTEYEKLIGSVPHWSGALYDGKIRLPVYNQNTTPLILKKLIFHELTHAFVLDISKMRCPIWLNEGLAQYQENKIIPIPVEILNQGIRNGLFINPADLPAYNITETNDSEKAAIFYIESFSLVAELIRAHDWYHMKQLLMELAKSPTFDDAFEKVYNRSFRDFAADWKTRLLRKK